MSAQEDKNTAKDAIKQMEQVMFDMPSQANNKSAKPCRACVDFKSWTKNLTGKKVSSSIILLLPIIT